mgnify:CR=1 FL=1
MAFFLNILLSLVLMVVSYLLMPKVKQETPETKDLDDPTAEAGRPIPVLFGTVTVKGLNVLWFGEKGRQTSRIRA